MRNAAGIATNPDPGRRTGATPRFAAPHGFFQTKRTTLNANLLYDFGLLSRFEKVFAGAPERNKCGIR
jgi:hypothetical protein